MDFSQGILLGFQNCLQPINLLYCFIGVLLGTLIGVLPGIGPTGTMAILLPVTFYAPPLATIIMLAGIYYGSQYGGSTTSILLNIPGEPSSVVTCLDGHQMARQGRAGPALGISAFGSFIAGTIGVIGLMMLAHPIVRFALRFGPPEYFSLMIMGLIILTYLTQKSLIKAISMGALGLILSFVGMDIVSGQIRYTYGIDVLLEGVRIVPVVMGFFGIAEVFENLEKKGMRSLYQTHIKGLLPSLKDWADSIWAIARGTVIGFFLGVLPGGGAPVASFVAYAVEKRVSKHPERLGKGAIEGVACPESANNAASSGAFVPLLTLGIPSNVVMAMLFVGLLIHNITPGPLLLKNRPDIFWGVITSMYIGNVMLLVLNLPLIGMWVQITKIPFRLLFPIIILVCIVGVYTLNNSVFDLWIMIIFGVVGYVLKKCQYEPAPLVLAYVLGPKMEQAMRQSLIISDGSFKIFLVRPISAVCLGIAAFLLITAIMGFSKKKRLEVVEEQQE
ncbi:MAG: tripartite tricarboxylate transporter permease [Thermodesulfobacteriota bacterium]|nr:tripartite tricarboxylate transporter permease [Thermodesulfobacteriota bacterium]